MIDCNSGTIKEFIKNESKDISQIEIIGFQYLDETCRIKRIITIIEE